MIAIAGSAHRAALAAFCVAMFATSAAFAQTVGDAAKGAQLFLQCRACHTVGATEASGVGPNLFGVFGANAGSKAGYTYSTGLTKSGLTWTAANLDLWLTKPTAVVPDTKMAFPGVKSQAARQDIIAYLATLTPPAPTKP